VVNPWGLHSAQGRQLLKDASRKQATEDGKSPQVLLSLVLHNGPGDTVETIDIEEAQGGICARCIYPSRKRRTVRAREYCSWGHSRFPGGPCRTVRGLSTAR
jgi:hypothetical protein